MIILLNLEQIRRKVAEEVTCIPRARRTRILRQIFHAEILHHFKTVEGEAGVRNHAADGRDETSVQRSDASLLEMQAG